MASTVQDGAALAAATVGAYPFPSLAAAAAAGLLIGYALRAAVSRRRRDLHARKYR